ncbi:MAG: hypothetical protein COW88_02605 [Candidatus Lloydbacteria bacterium CG22_combo_CG10-13_8_21_14_all_47_15]|uniref:Uncharacterized protein n=1 Tax=Candidatus Lloydbacteria bacterium CG22_combo_CG10-13_8_21_14_all_47_15 TaxID=1974635 RepID=A0A2H0CV14_9BACT|nr:MAG: hypothetical protein COW88_02605 [Candidatus Lloydbacteria bacterium CG22_combo_CG10-13_8_21_14_all_47_15]
MSDVEYYVETVSVASESGSQASSEHPVGGGNKPKRLWNAVVPGILAVFTFLLPIFFIPAYDLSTELGKVTLLAVVAFLSFFIWLVARLREGVIALPQTWLLFAIAPIILSALISALLSPSSSISLFGIGSEVHTFWFLFSASIMLFLVATTIRDYRKVLPFFAALFGAFFLVFIFHIVRLFVGPDVFSFGIYISPSASIIGKWNDVAIFSGLIAVLALFALQILSLSRVRKGFLLFTLFAALLLMLAINFGLAWIVFGVFALIALVYSLSFGARGEGRMRIAPLPLLLTVIALLASIFTVQIGERMSTTFSFSNLEARPTWRTTISIINETLADDPLWGVGPNRFSSQWLLHKPDSVTQSFFWNTDFNTGIGFIPTFAVTTGSVGALSWVLFLIVFLASGVRILTRLPTDRMRRFLLLGTYIGTAWLWVFAFFYAPNAAVFTFAFLMTGLFVATLRAEGMIRVFEWRFSDRPQKSFISVLFIIFFCIVSVVGVYIAGQKLSAAIVFQKGQALLARENNLDAAISGTRRAIEISKHDIFYRSLSNLLVADLRRIVATTNTETIDDIRLAFQSVLGEAIGSAQSAIEFDSTNYQNWRTLARIYTALVPLNIQGAYENAVRTYEEARTRNPKNPSLSLEVAQLELARGDIAAAKEHIGAALERKNNYTDALFLLSQIEMSEGKIKEAISSVEIASLINPTDPGIFFRLGFLRYSDSDYRGSISAFEQAILLQPNYANAKYFLGLAYYQTDNAEKALEEFEGIAVTNPNNQEVQAILANLRSGLTPFADLNTPPPEDRDSLPIVE